MEVLQETVGHMDSRRKNDRQAEELRCKTEIQQERVWETLPSSLTSDAASVVCTLEISIS